MKVQTVRAWMKANKITQETLAARLGYSHRVTVAANLRKGKVDVSPEFLGRLVTAYPETRAFLSPARPVAHSNVSDAHQPEAA